MENLNNYSFEISTDDKGLSTMTVKVDNDNYQKELDKILEKYKPSIEVKGFRKGKAPKEMILKQYGPSLEQEMQEGLIQSAWEDISKEKKIESMQMPNLTKMEKESDVFCMVFEYYNTPEFSLPDFASMQAQKDKYNITDSVVDEAYTMEIKKYSQFVEDNEATIEIGYKVTVDINFEKDEYKKYNKEIPMMASDSKEDIYYASQIVGMKNGESKTISIFVGEEQSNVTLTIKKIEKPDMVDDSKEEDTSVMKEEL